MGATLLDLLSARATRSDLRARCRFLRERQLNSVIINTGLRSFRSIFLRDLNYRRSGERLDVNLTCFLDRYGTVLLERRRVRGTCVGLDLYGLLRAGFAI